MSFSGFSLSKKMVSALKSLGYEEPSKVQSVVIPKALRGVSLLAQSETGSGKTHSYLIPIIEKTDLNLNRVQAIIVAPTRELARQTYDFARQFQRFYQNLRVRLYSSEADVTQNEEGRNIPPQIIIGTPGRLKDLLVDKHIMTLQNVRTVVLDEADMLLDMGFFSDIEALFGIIEDPQIMVFSATLRQNLRDELLKFVRSDFEFENDKTETASTVKHHMIDVKHNGSVNALVTFLRLRRPYLCIVFASTVKMVDEIHKGLKENGIDAIYFSGSLDDRSRKKAIREIRANKYSIIVASDLLSRGIDIPDVTDVISIDLPSDLDFYHHRAGRTGRFGKEGDSWVFYNADSVNAAKRIMEEGVKFDFYVLRKDELKVDTVGLLPKTKLSKKKELPEEERKEISIAKAQARPKHIEPMYKKKKQFAIEKVKRKYRKKAIQKSIRKELEKEYKAKAKSVNRKYEKQ